MAQLVARTAGGREVACSNQVIPTKIFGAWRSLVARTVRDGEVACSNQVAPTMNYSVKNRTIAVRFEFELKKHQEVLLFALGVP